MANLKDEVSKALEIAQEIATEKFGAQAVAMDPRLVTEIALLLAQMHGTRVLAVTSKKTH